MFLACEMCSKMPVNKCGQTPKDMICTKVASASKQQIMEMSSLFEEGFYVPVYRDEERGDVIVDRPSPKFSTILHITPTSSQSPMTTIDNASSSLFPSSPLSRSSSASSFTSERKSSSSPLTPIRLNGSAVFTNQSQKKLAAYVGPISTSAVIKFNKY